MVNRILSVVTTNEDNGWVSLITADAVLVWPKVRDKP